MGVVLNRISTPSFNEDETILLERLHTQVESSSIQDGMEKEMILSAKWDQELEKSSSVAIQRLKNELGYDILSLPKLGMLGGFQGGTPKVVQQMHTIFSRQFRMGV